MLEGLIMDKVRFDINREILKKFKINDNVIISMPARNPEFGTIVGYESDSLKTKVYLRIKTMVDTRPWLIDPELVSIEHV